MSQKYWLNAIWVKHREPFFIIKYIIQYNTEFLFHLFQLQD